MADSVSAIIAVAGTLLGSALTYWFQQKSFDRMEARRFHQRLWAERLRAYSAYTTALAELRRGQADWYNRRLEGPDSNAEMVARVESYRLRGLALAALSQVRLVAGDSPLVGAASEAFDMTRRIRHAQDSADYDARASNATVAVDRFIELASADVQAVATVGPGREDRRQAARPGAQPNG